MSLLPSRGPETSTTQDGELEVVGVDEDVAPLLDALSSETARDVLNAIYDEPGTPSEIADRLDMSIQKVSYHLDKLEDQELIAVAGTRYSEKGQEMTVYEPPEDPLVLFVGTEERKDSLRAMVKRLLPVVGALGIGSLLVDRLFGRTGPASSPVTLSSSEEAGGDEAFGGDDGDGAGGGDGADSGDGAGGDAGGDGEYNVNADDVTAATENQSAEATGLEADEGAATETPTEAAKSTPTENAGTPVAEETATETPAPTEESAMEVAEATETPTPEPTAVADEAATEPVTPTPELDTVTETVEFAESAGATLSPGVAFLLGGLFVVAIVVAWWAYAEYL